MLPVRLAQSVVSQYVRALQRPTILLSQRNTTTNADSSTSVATLKPLDPMPADFKEHPDRDVVNFPHYVTPMFNPKTRLGFIPNSWFEIFYKKTGESGGYFFYGGLLFFLMQKELYVMDHTYTCLLVIIGLSVVASKWDKGAAATAAMLDKEIDEDIAAVNEYRMSKLKNALAGIEQEKLEQMQGENVLNMITQAKKENVALQLEASYRDRVKEVHDAVNRRVQYMASVEEIKTRFKAKHAVDWVVGQVQKSITPALEQAVLAQCVVDLKRLANTV